MKCRLRICLWLWCICVRCRNRSFQGWGERELWVDQETGAPFFLLQERCTLILLKEEGWRPVSTDPFYDSCFRRCWLWCYEQVLHAVLWPVFTTKQSAFPPDNWTKAAPESHLTTVAKLPSCFPCHHQSAFFPSSFFCFSLFLSSRFIFQ